MNWGITGRFRALPGTLHKVDLLPKAGERGDWLAANDTLSAALLSCAEAGGDHYISMFIRDAANFTTYMYAESLVSQ